MALRDHFHPPLATRRHWHSFHNMWAAAIASSLNEHLPDGYFAEPNVQFGIEIDVAALQEPPVHQSNDLSNGTSPASVPVNVPAEVISPAPVQTLPFQPTSDTVEVTIYSITAGPILVGAIELVSPANKDRRPHRDAFIAKCETYLREGVGLVIVDIVTNRKANLHNELLTRVVGIHEAFTADLYVSSYRAIERASEPHLDIWPERLTLEQPLPATMPFWLRGDIHLALELNSTYERVCRELRIS